MKTYYYYIPALGIVEHTEQRCKHDAICYLRKVKQLAYDTVLICLGVNL